MGAATPTSSARAGRTASLSPGRAGAISPARASPQRRAFPGYDVGHSPRLIEHRAGAADRGLLAGSPGRVRSGGRSPPAPSVSPAARSSGLSADTFGGARSSRPSLTLDSPGHHHSLGAPRRPGTRLADTGRLTPGSAAGIGQQQVLTGSVTRTPSPMRTAPLPPRECSSATGRSTTWDRSVSTPHLIMMSCQDDEAWTSLAGFEPCPSDRLSCPSVRRGSVSVTGRPSRLCVSRRPFSGGLQTFQDLREMGKVYTFDAKFPVVPHTARNHGIDFRLGFR